MAKVEINLAGSQVTPFILAQIANVLESGDSVLVSNAAKPIFGPGIGAFLLGQAQAMLDMQKLEKRVDNIEDHPALSIPELPRG